MSSAGAHITVLLLDFPAGRGAFPSRHPDVFSAHLSLVTADADTWPGKVYGKLLASRVEKQNVSKSGFIFTVRAQKS